MFVTSYIALGSNLDEPERQLHRANTTLKSLSGSHFLKASHFYRTDPVGPAGQPDYINSVTAIETVLSPIALLDALQAIESDHGRVRSIRWGARALDLDILLYGNEIIETERLTIPHKEMLKRNFVLIPLADIALNITLPTGQNLKDILQDTNRNGIERLNDCLIMEK